MSEGEGEREPEVGLDDIFSVPESPDEECEVVLRGQVKRTYGVKAFKAHNAYAALMLGPKPSPLPQSQLPPIQKRRQSAKRPRPDPEPAPVSQEELRLTQMRAFVQAVEEKDLE